MVLIIKHEEIEGPGTLGYFFNSTHWRVETVELGNGGRLLATSSSCKNQAMRIGGAAWGLQFHPEVTLQMIEDWIDYYQPGNLNKKNLIDGYLEKRDRYYAQGQHLYQNFADIIANGH